jgi:hypothetical protein
MTNIPCIPGNSYVAIIVVLMIAAGIETAPVCGQQRMISYEEYLHAAGIHEEAEELKQFLRRGLQEEYPGMQASYYETNALFFSFILSLSGVNPQIASSLQNKGVNLIHAITAETRPLEEQSLLVDLVILGEVVRVVNDKEPEDGFGVSVEVRVKEFLKGGAPGDTIVMYSDGVTDLRSGDGWLGVEGVVEAFADSSVHSAQEAVTILREVISRNDAPLRDDLVIVAATVPLEPEGTQDD